MERKRHAHADESDQAEPVDPAVEPQHCGHRETRERAAEHEHRDRSAARARQDESDGRQCDGGEPQHAELAVADDLPADPVTARGARCRYDGRVRRRPKRQPDAQRAEDDGAEAEGTLGARTAALAVTPARTTRPTVTGAAIVSEFPPIRRIDLHGRTLRRGA